MAVCTFTLVTSPVLKVYIAHVLFDSNFTFTFLMYYFFKYYVLTHILFCLPFTWLYNVKFVKWVSEDY